jgi:hypothetical protein
MTAAIATIAPMAQYLRFIPPLSSVA